jgi:predicted metal-dependent hydrolase
MSATAGTGDEAAVPEHDGAPSPPARPPVRVVRSRRRTRTVSARLVAGELEIAIPSWMSRADEARWVAEMEARFARKRRTDHVDVDRRARALAARFDLPTPARVRWVGNMTMRWASCTPRTGEIRVSDRLAAFPAWVLDYVLVHELAHLAVADHSSRFWALVQRYPLAERACGYLIAKSGDEDVEPKDVEPEGAEAAPGLSPGSGW